MHDLHVSSGILYFYCHMLVPEITKIYHVYITFDWSPLLYHMILVSLLHVLSTLYLNTAADIIPFQRLKQECNQDLKVGGWGGGGKPHKVGGCIVHPAVPLCPLSFFSVKGWSFAKILR